MLTETEYINLWKTIFPKPKEVVMPSYCEYIKREIQFQDYQDLFIGRITYARTTQGILTINGCEINIGQHPFEKETIISGKRKIKYILVAEAPPLSKLNKKEILIETYFYDINHLGNTPYFKAVCKAFNIVLTNPLTNTSKTNGLVELANQGVILLDLFPFAIPFSSSLRKKLMGSGITKHFWDGDIYSIKTQITELCNRDCLDSEWDLCLIAPPTISCHIGGAYDSINIAPCTNGIHNNATFKVLLPNEKRGCDHKKVASDTSGNPNTELIKVAFDLPL